MILSIKVPGDKFRSKLHLREQGYTYSAFESFTKHCQGIKKFKDSCNLSHIYKNEFVKAFVAHDAAYPDSKDLVE